MIGPYANSVYKSVWCLKCVYSLIVNILEMGGNFLESDGFFLKIPPKNINKSSPTAVELLPKPKCLSRQNTILL